MIRRTTSFAVAGGLVAGLLIAQTAGASHYRGGAIVPSVDANGLVTFTSTSYWRRLPSPTEGFPVAGTDGSGTGEGSFSLNSSGIGNPGSASWGTGPAHTRTVDLTDSRFARVVETYTYQLSQAGTYSFEWSSCCHVGGIANAGGGEDLDATIVWDGQTANAPILFDISAINPEVIRGSAYSDNLGAVSGSGLTLSYNEDLSTGMTSQPPGFDIDSTGQLSIPGASTATMTNENTGENIGADYAFSGNILASDGSSVEFEWLFDAVDTGSGNLAPVVNDLVINVMQGDVVNATVTGSDPNSDPLTWNLQGIFGPGDTSAFMFNPATQAIMWDTTGVALGSYIANVRASDGSLTDVGTVTINVSQNGTPPDPDPGVPAPGVLSLLGLGLVGLGAMRRRKSVRS